MAKDKAAQAGSGPVAGGYWCSLLPSRRDYAAFRYSWRTDLMAGLTVGIVALPLALAFGVSSGAGAEAGLISAIVAGVVAAVFGGSNVQVSGPTGAMVVVLAPIIATHGAGVLGLLCLMAGGLIVVAGLLRLGRLVGAIPWPVIEGFTHGIAVIIFLQQVPVVVGVHGHKLSSNAVVAGVQSIRWAEWSGLAWTAGGALVVALFMLVGVRVSRKTPWSLVGLVVVTLAFSLAGSPASTIGELPSGLPTPGLPEVNWEMFTSLLGGAVTVAALAAIESLLSARVAAQHRQTGPLDADRELVGQGLASIAVGFFGGMPANGAIARTAVNVSSGARTRAAAITHALVLVLVVYTAGSVVSRVPLAALAGVLMVTAIRMVPLSAAKALVRLSRQDAILFSLTALITVSMDLIYAVLIGIAAAAVFALRTVSQIAGVYRQPLPDPVQPEDDQIAAFQIDGALFFATAGRLAEQVSHIDGVQVVVLGMDRVRLLDSTGAQVLGELAASLRERGLSVFIHSIKPEHQSVTHGAGVFAVEAAYPDLNSAAAKARALVATLEPFTDDSTGAVD
ncbi:MAG: SulP family inorganic anion transporter [Micrococcales bacterium]|nr:SulP family inorganic anion transporter [Micrococcales bacterium]